VIDAHHHFLDPAQREYPWIGAAEAPINRRLGAEHLAPLLQAHGVSATVLVQTVGTEEESLAMLAASTEHGWIAGVVGWVDLTAGDVSRQICRLRDALGGDRLVGIRHGVADEPDPLWLLQPSVLRGLDAVADAGLVFDLEVGLRELPAARSAAGQLRHLQFVLDHAGKPPIASGTLDVWQQEIAGLAALENVACKMSGLVTEASWDDWTLEELQPVAAHVLRHFGPGRIMFGSDWPVCELAADYSRVVDTARDLCGTAWPVIADHTAQRIYRLAPLTVPSGLSDATSVTPS
jgi:L-fuconolactonase